MTPEEEARLGARIEFEKLKEFPDRKGTLKEREARAVAYLETMQTRHLEAPLREKDPRH